MNKIAHILVLLVFSVCCWFLWAILHLAPRGAPGGEVPAFTTLCVDLRPVLLVLPALAALYCVWILLRKADRLPSWVAFFATTMSVLVLVTFPTLVATYLPLVNSIYLLSKK
jgi:hypothetical protein